MEPKSTPLIKEFQDLILMCKFSFSNEQYQERPINPSKTIRMNIKKLPETYLLKCVYQHRHSQFVKNFSITGEYNLDFYIQVPTAKINTVFMESIVIEKNDLRKFVSKNTSGKKDVESPSPIILETQAYIYAIDNDDLFPLRITFKKNKSSLIPVSAEIELPHRLCDEWYELCAKYYSQYTEGLLLIK